MIKFVVCVWNAENYIKNCIKTIKNQKDNEFEVYSAVFKINTFGKFHFTSHNQKLIFFIIFLLSLKIFYIQANDS
jgi:hypothetical protein